MYRYSTVQVRRYNHTYRKHQLFSSYMYYNIACTHAHDQLLLYYYNNRQTYMARLMYVYMRDCKELVDARVEDSEVIILSQY